MKTNTLQTHKKYMKKLFFVFTNANGQFAADVTTTNDCQATVTSWTNDVAAAFHADERATANWFSPRLEAVEAGEYEVSYE